MEHLSSLLFVVVKNGINATKSRIIEIPANFPRELLKMLDESPILLYYIYMYLSIMR